MTYYALASSIIKFYTVYLLDSYGNHLTFPEPLLKTEVLTLIISHVDFFQENLKLQNFWMIPSFISSGAELSWRELGGQVSEKPIKTTNQNKNNHKFSHVLCVIV